MGMRFLPTEKRSGGYVLHKITFDKVSYESYSEYLGPDGRFSNRLHPETRCTDYTQSPRFDSLAAAYSALGEILSDAAESPFFRDDYLYEVHELDKEIDVWECENGWTHVGDKKKRQRWLAMSPHDRAQEDLDWRIFHEEH